MAAPTPQATRQEQAQLGNAREQEVHALRDLKGQKVTLQNADIKPEATLYIKGCEDTEITFDAKCTKIMIEGCRRCKVDLKGRIITNIVEIWKCADFTMDVTATVKTLQLDICRNLTLNFESRDRIHDIVWAGVYNLNITIKNEPATPAFVSGYDQMKVEHPDLSPITDQFYVRNIDGKLTSEIVIRLANGYPSTEREAQEFDNQKEKNARAAEEFAKQRLLEAGITLGRKKPEGPRIGRNDPCRCGSGKKYKNCCDRNELKN